MLPVTTITVNPCIDISVHLDVLVPDKKQHCNKLKKEPGGGGINVSRAMERLGGNTTAIYMAGGYTGDYFTAMLQKEQVHTKCIPIKDHTRENIVVAEDVSGLQYRFGMPGPFIREAEWNKCLEELSLLHEPGFIVASGSLAEGMPENFFAQVAVIARQKNSRLVLDTCGAPLKAALNEGIYLFKPNLGELATLADVAELNRETAISFSKELISKQQCEVVIISMGPAGALLITETLTDHIMAPAVKIKSTVGAGDSMVAGILLALSKGSPLQQAVRYGVACGTAATMNEGTALCAVKDVEYLYSLIR